MDTTRYSPAVRELLAEDRLCVLGPGQANQHLRDRLGGLSVETLFAPTPVRQVSHAQACLAGLWLYHDFLDESHNLSQSIDTVDGSYWHGILHRREPDYSNAGYWFRKVGRHPVFEPLGTVARELSVDVPLPWDPFWFIDFCEQCAHGRDDREMLARQIQQREWELLFAHCYRHAIA